MLGSGDGGGLGDGSVLGCGDGDGSTLGTGDGEGLGDGSGAGLGDGSNDGDGSGAGAGESDGVGVGSIAPTGGTIGVKARPAATNTSKAPNAGPARCWNARVLVIGWEGPHVVPVRGSAREGEVPRAGVMAGPRRPERDVSAQGRRGTGVGPDCGLVAVIVPVGSWQAWHVPRLSIFRRRLSPTGADEPPGFFRTLE